MTDATGLSTKSLNRFLWVILLFAIAAVLIGIHSVPDDWTSNEVNYFDLAYRFVAPEEFGPDHAVFDHSNGRFLSFTIIGEMISVYGFETSKVVLGFIVWLLTAAAFVFLAASMRLTLAEATAALAIFVGTSQALLAQEWVFGTVEAKTFAYPTVFLALGFALRRKYWLAIGLTALATYFHFLVGGFWALAVVLIAALSAESRRRVGTLFAGYVLFVLPMIVILGSERLNSDVDMTGVDHTIDYIYAVIRNHHHIAPFLYYYSFINDWVPGLLAHAAFAVIFAYWAITKRSEAHVLGWTLSALNLYILLAVVVAYLDRNTHALAAFYLFRPAGLIWLLSLLGLARFVGSFLAPAGTRPVAAMVFVLAGAFAFPKFYIPFENAALEYRTMYETLEGSEKAAFDWVRENTDPGAVVVMEPVHSQVFQGEYRVPTVAVERLTERPTVVNFKFVPTYPPDIAEWYRLIRWREALFAGDCSQLEMHPADYLIIRQHESIAGLAECTEVVMEGNGHWVARVVTGTAS